MGNNYLRRVERLEQSGVEGEPWLVVIPKDGNTVTLGRLNTKMDRNPGVSFEAFKGRIVAHMVGTNGRLLVRPW